MIKKPRNGGRWTESKYFTNIRNCFRKLSMRWEASKDVFDASRRPYTGENKRRKWEYGCKACGLYFTNKKIPVILKTGKPGFRNQIEVDHIMPVGSLKTYEDLPRFVARMLCEADNLQVLCMKCHDAKTLKEKKHG